ncbi:aminotransferase class V-fold PLP-dependent enzyme [Lachnospiraceae bacterium PAL227]|uniref:Aminotransferase class V-fold PLP-dependent enzyme n=1 Tax=Ohessyouella blattaphilus TaxID=2949333 RepID=A0ABT1EP01_9FIRM|nr:aminotransferase class V-fold PLP-dependent enzyme [Ohessyouella blattaphilus]MCP1111436.1 aminotransferase class V-fold PLP-dependent enzyme [Ohessyouella blattaphilus]MCR8564830.1 aminotransferase class V-fold PLP-dependent enzyme [Ohessyouella blattaphilus]
MLNEKIQEIRNKSEVYYLNTAAMSLSPPCVEKAVTKYYKERERRGPNFSEYWNKADILRELLGEKLHCSAKEIMFTQSTSMGINLVAGMIPFEPGDNVVITDIEFPSNVYPWMNLKNRGVATRFAKNKNGALGLEEIQKLCDNHTKAVSISWVQATNGYIANLKEIGSFCRERNLFRC